MDRELARLIDLDTPKLNPSLASGLAVKATEDAVEYIDAAFRAASFPDFITYEGYRPCSPTEEFEKVTNKNITKKEKQRSKRYFSVDQSDMYLVAFNFKFQGKMLPPHYIYIPFVSEGGYIHIRGSRFQVSPVLADRIISVGKDNVFIRLLKARLTFKRLPYHVMRNDRQAMVQLIYSDNIHNAAANRKAKGVSIKRSSLGHYLFARYGLAEAFLRFAQCTPVVGGVEVNRNVYNEDEWVIFTSRRIPPQGTPKKAPYTPTTLRLAVRRTEMNPMVEQLAVCLFYLADRFPQRVVPEYLNHTNLWRILLGQIILPDVKGEGTLQFRMDSHISSLDKYIDGFTRKKMEKEGTPITDIYQMFALVMERFNHWIIDGAKKLSSMYDKELSVKYYMLNGIVVRINHFAFNMSAPQKKPLTAEMVIDRLGKIIKRHTAFKITSGHGEVSTSGYPGDNKAFNATTRLVPQAKANIIPQKGKKKGGGVSMKDPMHYLHVSVAEVGGYSSMTKSEGYGRDILNPHVSTDADNNVLRNPERRDLLDSVQVLVDRDNREQFE